MKSVKEDYFLLFQAMDGSFLIGRVKNFPGPQPGCYGHRQMIVLDSFLSHLDIVLRTDEL